jgi:hypothetical protein
LGRNVLHGTLLSDICNVFEVSNRFAALEDLDAEVEINTVWEMNR